MTLDFGLSDIILLLVLSIFFAYDNPIIIPKLIAKIKKEANVVYILY
jgi:hypothetical protein